MCEEIIFEGFKLCKCCNRALPAVKEYFNNRGRGMENTCRECKGLKFYDTSKWTCPTCGKELPFTEEYWKPSKAESCGWITCMCRECWNEYYRKYAKEKPEWRREKERKYKERNPKKYAEKMKRHREKAKLEGKNTYKYVMAHASDRTKERIKRRGESLRRKLYEKLRWQRRKGEEYRARARELNRLDPTKKRASVSKHRVMKAGNQGEHTGELFKVKFAFHGYRCYYCHTPLTLQTATEDHRIPISRGGADWIANIVPACRSCNSSKGAKTESEYWDYLEKLEDFRKRQFSF